MWELDHKEGWVLKNWCFWTVVLEKTPESPLDCKEIKPVSPEGNPPWILIGRINGEAEALILWPPDVKSRLIRKDPDTGKDWRQEEKGATDDEMLGWHQRLKGHEFEKTLRDGEGQGSLACCSPWDRKSRTWLSDWTTINGRYKRGVLREKWEDKGLASSWPWQSWAMWKQAHTLSFC